MTALFIVGDSPDFVVAFVVRASVLLKSQQLYMHTCTLLAEHHFKIMKGIQLMQLNPS